MPISQKIDRSKKTTLNMILINLQSQYAIKLEEKEDDYSLGFRIALPVSCIM